MIGRGIFNLDINGSSVGFKFGMYASGVTEKEAGCGISDVFKKITTGQTTFGLLTYFYGGYVSYQASKGKEPLSISDFSDLLEKVDLDKLIEIYNKSLESPESKNATAPQAGGLSVLKTATS